MTTYRKPSPLPIPGDADSELAHEQAIRDMASEELAIVIAKVLAEHLPAAALAAYGPEAKVWVEQRDSYLRSTRMRRRFVAISLKCGERLFYVGVNAFR